MRLVLPYGFYTAGNTGDEATLNGFACLLQEHPALVSGVRAASRRPELMSRVEPAFTYFSMRRRDLRRWWALQRGTAGAIVGATPIHDLHGDGAMSELHLVVNAMKRRRIPVAFVGVGVEQLHQDRHRRLIADEFAPLVQHWTPRSSRGRKRLIEYGVPPERITLAADLAWLIDPVHRSFGDECLREWGMNPAQPLIGVGIASELFDETPHLTDALAAALDTLVDERDAQLLFFVHDVSEAATSDLKVATAIVARMKQSHRARTVPNRYFTPRQFMSLIGCCEQTVSMRYHFCVYSAVQGVPFTVIQNTDKVLDLCADMSWTSTLVLPDISAEAIVETMRRLRTETPSPHATLAQIVKRMRQLSLENMKSLLALSRP